MDCKERVELANALDGIKKEIHGNGRELDSLYDRLDDIACYLKVIACYCVLHTGADKANVDDIMTRKGW